MENTTMKWENTSMKALSGVLCYCTLTPVVKYNCIMFLLKYKTTHKYTVTTQIFLYFFQKCCSLYITANTTECVQMICTEQTIGYRPVQSTKKERKFKNKKGQKN